MGEGIAGKYKFKENMNLYLVSDNIKAKAKSIKGNQEGYFTFFKENHIYGLRNMFHGPWGQQDSFSFCFPFSSSTLVKKNSVDLFFFEDFIFK